VDGSLSVNDTATFGNLPTNPTTVSLDGVSPALAALTFSNSAASYTLAPGSGGSVTVGTAGSTGTINTTAGSHQITADLAIGRDTGVATSAGTVLTLAGALSGSGVVLAKTGGGLLAITGTGGFSGETTVTEGTLKVNGSIASSGVTVQSGATLAGSGTVGATTIEAGGTITIVQNNSELNLVFSPVPVPEPSAIALLVAAATSGVWTLRRRGRAGPSVSSRLP
jgi:fibronectin-binding autotransporter adhesin